MVVIRGHTGLCRAARLVPQGHLPLGALRGPEPHGRDERVDEDGWTIPWKKGCLVMCLGGLISGIRSAGVILMISNSVAMLGVLTGIVKDGCLTGGAHRRARRIRCYLQCIHSP